MPITLTYTGTNVEVQRAVTKAAAMLTSNELLEIIRRRKTPFDDSVPANLSPSKIAEYFRDTNLELTVETYSGNDPDIGGYFNTGRPTVIHVNLKNLPQRRDCSTAAMLVHECTHALSYQIKKKHDISFSHTGPRSNNNQTAPYWIQKKVRLALCNDKNIQVEALDTAPEEVQ